MAVSVDLLRPLSLFKGMSDAELERIASLCQVQAREKGTLICQEGTDADALYVVLKGKVALEKMIQLSPRSRPRPATLEVLETGDSFGWSTVVEPHVFTKSALSLCPVELLRVDGEGLRALLNEDHHIGHELMASLTKVVASRLQDAMDTLSYFVSIISHELRAPIAAVDNYLQVILGGYTGPLNAQQQSMMERCCVRLQELSDMLSSILDLARMRPEQIESDFTTVLPHEVFLLSVEDVLLSAKEKRIDLRVDVTEDLPEMIGAPNRLRQVFTNLLTNAIKFAQDGGQVCLRAQDQQDHLLVEVVDNGPGIAPEHLPHIFEAFYRPPDTEETGLGLGLSIVKRIVDAHRGKIVPESPYPPDGTGGTRMLVLLPKDPLEHPMHDEIDLRYGSIAGLHSVIKQSG
jgi:signal transduction histidine kinase